MIPSTFDYVRPNTVDEAVAALKEGGEDSKVITGGQSMLPLLRMRLASPSILVDCGRIDEMKGIKETDDSITIGAATSHHAVLTSDLVSKYAKLLSLATATVADPQVRHRGTFGGALAHGDPAGDLPAVTLVLNATMEIAGPNGRRKVEAKNFFIDYFTTAVGPDEVLVSISIPKMNSDWGVHYEKFNRTAQCWAIVGVAAAVRRDGNKIAEALVGLTNVAPVPMRASKVEAALTGADATLAAIQKAAELAAEGTHPTSDLHAAADYREHLMRILTGRALSSAAQL
jgi:carbon-monoxide dehydrogenase medium subunit